MGKMENGEEVFGESKQNSKASKAPFFICCQLWTRCVPIGSLSPFLIDPCTYGTIVSIALIALNRKQPFISSLLTPSKLTSSPHYLPSLLLEIFGQRWAI